MSPESRRSTTNCSLGNLLYSGEHPGKRPCNAPEFKKDDKEKNESVGRVRVLTSAVGRVCEDYFGQIISNQARIVAPENFFTAEAALTAKLDFMQKKTIKERFCKEISKANQITRLNISTNEPADNDLLTLIAQLDQYEELHINHSFGQSLAASFQELDRSDEYGMEGKFFMDGILMMTKMVTHPEIVLNYFPSKNEKVIPGAVVYNNGHPLLQFDAITYPASLGDLEYSELLTAGYPSKMVEFKTVFKNSLSTGPNKLGKPLHYHLGVLQEQLAKLLFYADQKGILNLEQPLLPREVIFIYWRGINEPVCRVVSIDSFYLTRWEEGLISKYSSYLGSQSEEGYLEYYRDLFCGDEEEEKKFIKFLGWLDKIKNVVIEREREELKKGQSVIDPVYRAKQQLIKKLDQSLPIDILEQKSLNINFD